MTSAMELLDLAIAKVDEMLAGSANGSIPSSATAAPPAPAQGLKEKAYEVMSPME